jgi:hypothetical protein
MRILAKRCFVLRAGNESIKTVPLLIQDIPERYSACGLFKMAVADGDIQVLASPSAQKAAEKQPAKPARGGKRGKPESGDKLAAIPPEAETLENANPAPESDPETAGG